MLIYAVYIHVPHVVFSHALRAGIISQRLGFYSVHISFFIVLGNSMEARFFGI